MSSDLPGREPVDGGVGESDTAGGGATPAPVTLTEAPERTAPSEAGEPTEPAAADPEPAEVLAAELLALPGVAGLHGGLFGEVATYLPGRRVSGIRLDDEQTDVHVTVAWGAAVHDVVEAVRRTTQSHTRGTVDVYVEDVAPPVQG